MKTNTVAQAQRELTYLTRLYRDSDQRLAMLIAERRMLQADIEAAQVRYQDALQAGRLREQGAAAVAAAVRVLGERG